MTSYRADKQVIDTHTHTDTGNDNTRRPKLASGKNSIFKLALLIGTFRAPFDKVLRLMIQKLTDDKSTLVQVMAWCRQATSHYMSQC